MSADLDAVRIFCVRISNYRALENVEVNLDGFTVLVGCNNSGKTSFLEAMNCALGLVRRSYGGEDILLREDESRAPLDRSAVIDVLVKPLDDEGLVAKQFPDGSFWTQLWGTGISQDDEECDFMAFRTTIQWDVIKGEYVQTKRFLKEWLPFDEWLEAEERSAIRSSQIEPIALQYVDAKRDLEDDLRRPGSFWRRLTDDLGLADSDIAEFEDALTELNNSIMSKSAVLKHLRDNLGDLKAVVAPTGAGVDISPVARKLRDLSRGVDVSFSASGSAAFPLTRHGMGTRSLASLFVFKAYVSWKSAKVAAEGDRIHPVLALEEPESHLHPHAQRALYGQIKSIPGQRLVSTHSAYFAAQAELESLRFFVRPTKGGGTNIVTLDVGKLNADERRQLERTVLASRGDLIFCRAMVLFEGETEEQAIPIWAEHMLRRNLHELGVSFVGVGGQNYFPFIWLADSLGIPWFVLSDGEDDPVRKLERQLVRAGVAQGLKDERVICLPRGRDLEEQLVSEGYQSEIEAAIEALCGKGHLDDYIASLDGTPKKRGLIRKYSGDDGRLRAILDLMRENKTRLAPHLARQIAGCGEKERQVPAHVRAILDRLSVCLGLA